MSQRRKPIKRTPLKRGTKRIRARRVAPRRGPPGIPADQWRNAPYRQFLREHGLCVACSAHGLFSVSGRPSAGAPCDPMHGPPLGVRQKCQDAGPGGCIPGCRGHHDEQTRIGWPAFEKLYGFDRMKESVVWWTAFTIWREAQ